jgi:transcriptional regulator with XRE-family HTH domain
MATLKKPKVTRIKRDYPEFRDRLRDTIAERDLTQTKAAEMVGMDIRTFNHVVSGPTHPDLMLLKDIGSKFDVNLNYLFGLSDRKQRHPKDFGFHDYRVLDWAKVEEGAEYPKQTEQMALPKSLFERHGDLYGVEVTHSELDVIDGSSFFLGFFKYVDEVSAKGVYHAEFNGRSYFRWMKRNEWGGIMISADVLMEDNYEVKPEEIKVVGKLVRKSADF